MGKIILTLVFFVLGQMCSKAQQSELTITKNKLQDKIKGGWAGQTIGVTFGGAYEFGFQGTFIDEYQKLEWNDTLLRHNMIKNPGLYDDLYMDLTFVDVMEKNGLDAPLELFANSFANADYFLWHANQAARYNILNGISAPQSGYWKNNPHADCIDYQIESDFAGLMSPGMPNTASEISDKIGHIMNYGDGWYGGVFVGAMYTIAFTSDDIHHIVEEALKTIPEESNFYKCISDVIHWHERYPDDWKQTWFEIQRKWANDISCPEGVFLPFNIDATVNAAYVVTGLLYGNGDYTRSLEIATRCGQDADCNPATVGGVLGTVLGYDKIPAFWKQGLKEIEDIDFKYTTMSLNTVYKIGLKHALENIKRNGGIVTDQDVTIKIQNPQSVKYEKSFEGLHPVELVPVQWTNQGKTIRFSYFGTGFVIKGNSFDRDDRSDVVINTELYIDGKLTQTNPLPVNFLKRRYDIAWDYTLPLGQHEVELKFLSLPANNPLSKISALYYSDKPVNGLNANEAAAKEFGNQ